MFLSVLCLLWLCARLFKCALWSPAGKGLTSWLSFVVSYCEFVTFPLVSWVRCGTWLYWFLIFASLLTLHSLMATKKEKPFYCYNHYTRRHEVLQKSEKRHAEKREVNNRGQNVQLNKINWTQYSQVRLLKQTLTQLKVAYHGAAYCNKEKNVGV